MTLAWLIPPFPLAIRIFIWLGKGFPPDDYLFGFGEQGSQDLEMVENSRDCRRQFIRGFGLRRTEC